MTLRLETMRPGFEKLHLGDGRVLHWITTPDGEEAHSHPFAIDVQFLVGSYDEEVWSEAGPMAVLMHPERLRQTIAADRIHRICGVSPGGCLTLCTYGAPEREVRFYRKRDGAVQSRLWNEEWAS